MKIGETLLMVEMSCGLTWICSVGNKQHPQRRQIHILMILLSQQTPVHVTWLDDGHRRWAHTQTHRHIATTGLSTAILYHNYSIGVSIRSIMFLNFTVQCPWSDCFLWQRHSNLVLSYMMMIMIRLNLAVRAGQKWLYHHQHDASSCSTI